MDTQSLQSLPSEKDRERGTTRTGCCGKLGNASSSKSSSNNFDGISKITTFSFGIGGMSIALLNDVPAFFLSDFLLSTVGLSGNYSGTLLLIAKVVDAFSDPLIGSLTDKTRSRWGRRRPWILAAGPIGAFFNFMLWQSWPLFDSDIQKFVYYLIFFCCVSVSMTSFAIPYSALNVEISTLDKDRIQLTQYRTVFYFVGMILGVIVMGSCLSFIGDSALAHRLGSFFIGLLLIAFTTICFFGVRELDYDLAVKENHATFLMGLKAIFSSKAYMLLVFSSTLNWMSSYFIQSNLIAYTKYSVFLYDWFAIVLIIVLIFTIIFAYLLSLIMKRIGKKATSVLGSACLLLLYLGLYFCPAEKLGILIFLSSFAGVGIAAINLIPWSMLPDVVDMDEITHGERREGIFCAFFIFFNKAAIGIALAFSNFILDSSGLDDEKEPDEQPDQVNLSVRLLMSAAPAVTTLLSLLLLYLYPINAETQKKNSETLKANRLSKSQESSPLSDGSSSKDFDD